MRNLVKHEGVDPAIPKHIVNAYVSKIHVRYKSILKILINWYQYVIVEHRVLSNDKEKSIFISPTPHYSFIYYLIPNLLLQYRFLCCSTSSKLTSNNSVSILYYYYYIKNTSIHLPVRKYKSDIFSSLFEFY